MRERVAKQRADAEAAEAAAAAAAAADSDGGTGSSQPWRRGGHDYANTALAATIGARAEPELSAAQAGAGACAAAGRRNRRNNSNPGQPQSNERALFSQTAPVGGASGFGGGLGEGHSEGGDAQPAVEGASSQGSSLPGSAGSSRIAELREKRRVALEAQAARRGY